MTPELFLVMIPATIAASAAVMVKALSYGKDTSVARNLDVSSASSVARDLEVRFASLRTEVDALRTETSALRELVHHYQTDVAEILLATATRLGMISGGIADRGGDNSVTGTGSLTARCSLGDQGLCQGECESCFARRTVLAGNIPR